MYIESFIDVFILKHYICETLYALELSLMLFQNKRVSITFGYNTKSKDQYGVMMYHKNRLIKAYERVGCQLKVRLCCNGYTHFQVLLNVIMQGCYESLFPCRPTTWVLGSLES